MTLNRDIELGHSSEVISRLRTYSDLNLSLLELEFDCGEGNDELRLIISELLESEIHLSAALEGTRLLMASAEMMRGQWDVATSLLLSVFNGTDNLNTQASCAMTVRIWLRHNCDDIRSQSAIIGVGVAILRGADVTHDGDWDYFLPLLVRLTERVAPLLVPMEAWLPLAIAFHGETGLLKKSYNCAELVHIGGAYLEDRRVFYEMHALATWDARRLKTPFWQERGRQYIAAQEAAGGPVDPRDFSPIRAREGDEKP